MVEAIYGSAPGVEVDIGGPRAVFHRYEIVGDGLVRRRLTDRRPFIDGDVSLVDILLYEDRTGRYIGMVRGFTVRERDLARLGQMADSREFTVEPGIVLAIGRDLEVGPYLERRLRLVVSDGKRVDERGQQTSRSDAEAGGSQAASHHHACTTHGAIPSVRPHHSADQGMLTV